jgi:hypothetical protein
MRFSLAICLLGCATGGGDAVSHDAATAEVSVDSSSSDTRPSETLIFDVDDPKACPTTLCGGECVDLAADPRHCSMCGNACRADQYCRLGAGPVCKCRPPAVACAGDCKDRNSDPTACGDCDIKCPKACARGACVDACPLELKGCPNGALTACVDIKKDPRTAAHAGRPARSTRSARRALAHAIDLRSGASRARARCVRRSCRGALAAPA